MKIISSILIMLVWATVNAQAQQGSTCATAIQITPTNSHSYSNYVINSKVVWIKFIASTTFINVALKTQPFGINAEHVHEITLFNGNCNNLIVLANDNLPFVDYANQLTIDLNAKQLVPGNTYYLKIDRNAPNNGCDKINCKSNNPATFELAVENVDLLLPPDYLQEVPPLNYSYHQNRGQLVDVNGNFVPNIKMYNKQMTPQVYIGDEYSSFVWAKINADSNTTDSMHRVDMYLEKSNEFPTILRADHIPDATNFILPHCPQGVSCSASYGRTVIKEIYPDIDMHFAANENGLKLFFIVYPGGNANDVVLRFDGASSVNVTPPGGLAISTPLGTLDFEAPHAYQLNTGNQVVPMPSQARFVAMPNNKVKFSLRNYNRNMPLILQVDRGHTEEAPPTDFWMTYYGGSGDEQARDVAIDNQGNTYMVGTTLSTNFPLTPGAFQSQLGKIGENDAFVVKFNTNRSRDWATFYGGSNHDNATGVATDPQGNVYLTGWTFSTGFPLCSSCPGFYQGTKKGSADAYIVKLNPNGTAPQLWATYFGGDDIETAYSIAVNSNTVYLTGSTTSKAGFPFPTSQPAGAYTQTTYGGDGTGGPGDGYVAMFNTSNDLLWSSYWGGEHADALTGCAVDQNGNLLVTGFTFSEGKSSCTPIAGQVALCDPGGGAYVNGLSGQSDAVIAKFNANGALLWSTLYGGSSVEVRQDNINDHGITVDGLNHIWVTGSTISSDLPLQNAVQSSLAGSWDLFILKFNQNGVRQFASYYGGSETDYGQAIVADNSGNAFVTGVTFSNNFPVVNHANFYNQGSFGGDNDIFITGFDQNNQDFWSTYLGGNCREKGYGLALSNTANGLLITGETASANFPTFDLPGNQDYYDGTFNGGLIDCFGGDAFIGSLCMSCPASTVYINERQPVEDNLINMQVYPNPSQSVFNVIINLQKQQPILLEVFDITGKKVYHQTYADEMNVHHSIDFNGFAKGMYLIKLTTGGGFITRKVLLQ